MAIVKMRKLNLVAMSYDKNALLDALHRTNAVEVTLHDDRENTIVPTVDTEDMRGYYASVETALNALCNAVERKTKEESASLEELKDGFDVSYSEFIAIKERRVEADSAVEEINALLDERNALKATIVKLLREKEQAEVYSQLQIPFSCFGDSLHTKGWLGIIPTNAFEGVQNALASYELCSYQKENANSENVLLYVVAHKSIAGEIADVLSAYSFTQNPYQLDEIGAVLYSSILQKEKEAVEAIAKNESTMYALKDKIRLLKVYCDYLAFTLEKEEVNEKLRSTSATFMLQAYVPVDAEEAVKMEIESVTTAAYMEFSDPTDEDEPPTLLKNNPVVSNFESITNTYSTPNYRELDPNVIMAFFYSLFMGFIIADMGYGLLMAIGGCYIWWKNKTRPTGVSRLAGAFGVAGFFAIFWGAMFNSLFGLMIFPSTIMPNPQTDMWTLVGISVPSVLIISMVLGITQLCVGYLCKAAQEWRRGNILDGIFSGVVWAIFSIGVALAIVGFVEEANLPLLVKIGGVMAGVSLLIAILTAGRKEKFFGKFSKGFGAAYGVINYLSDILSYARLYGLMLSGAVIAQIIAQYSTQFFTSGNVALIILGVIILLVGHAFNLVMNLLGAYIHDARLQYVEFYGRFYEGEGEEFKPLGSKQKYIYLQPRDRKLEKKA